MKQFIGAISLLVKDYDEAIAYYTQKLDFQLVEDTKLSEHKRWVLIAPPGSSETKILLAKAKPEQLPYCGNQTGGRVFLFLKTQQFWEDYERMLAKGIQFIDKPRSEDYGHVIVFEDLYGNKWDFVEDLQN